MSIASSTEKSNCARKTRLQLIEAGLDELIQYGYQNFSTRRVAKKCGVSCATPYKHFEDTDAFIAAIMGHIDEIYIRDMEETIKQHAGASPKEQLAAIAFTYIGFAVKHPDYYNISSRIPLNHPASKFSLSSLYADTAKDLIARHFEENPVEPAVRDRILFVARSTVYGAALIFSSGQMEYNETNRRMIEDLLLREL